MNAINTDNRHPATQQIGRWFDYDHLTGSTRETSAACAALAERMILTLDDGPQLTTGLRKLLEAKDCFVRAAIDKG